MPSQYESYASHRVLCGGHVIIYTTKASKKKTYQARITLPGVSQADYCVRKSLKTTDENEAISFAQALYYDALGRNTQDIPLEPTSWTSLVSRYEHEFPDKSKASADATRYLTPFFGSVKDVRSIDTALVRKFWLWRWDYHKGFVKPPGKVSGACVYHAAPTPHINTLNALRVSLKSILTWAHQQGIVSSLPNTDIPRRIVNAAPKENSRGTFTLKDYQRLYTNLRTTAHRVNLGVGVRGNHKQQQIGIERVRFMVLLIANTCIRPTEALQLRHSDFCLKQGTTSHEVENDIAYTEITIRKSVSKTGRQRSVISHDYAATWKYYQRFLAVLEHHNMPTGREDLVFANTRHPHKPANITATFRSLLERWDMLKDADGRNRVLYSLRSFAITQALQRTVPIHVVARNAGTSVRMIEKHYWRDISWSFRDVITKNRRTIPGRSVPSFSPDDDDPTSS
jgi:integrase